MKRRLQLLVVLLYSASVPVFAQHPGEAPHPAESRPPAMPANPPRANEGRVPPAPVRRESDVQAETEKRENGKINASQHVNNDHWYGHDAPNDQRYHLDHPFPHGHFERFGANYRYNIVKIDRDHHRFWFPGGFYFEVASWDWFICADWCWQCGDDFVVYEDPDHPGWYLLYNVHTGAYVHVQYLGS
jgi:hypothetical protein